MFLGSFLTSDTPKFIMEPNEWCLQNDFPVEYVYNIYIYIYIEPLIAIVAKFLPISSSKAKPPKAQTADWLVKPDCIRGVSLLWPLYQKSAA